VELCWSISEREMGEENGLKIMLRFLRNRRRSRKEEV